MIIDKHINWQKLKGKSNASMQEITGFGFLSILEVGKRMVVQGDYGVTTTEVKSIENRDDDYIVKTMNSIYLIRVVP